LIDNTIRPLRGLLDATTYFPQRLSAGLLPISPLRGRNTETFAPSRPNRRAASRAVAQKILTFVALRPTVRINKGLN